MGVKLPTLLYVGVEAFCGAELPSPDHAQVLYGEAPKATFPSVSN